MDNTMYKQIVRYIMYVCNSRLDIYFSVKVTRRFIQEPKLSHMKLVKKINTFNAQLKHFTWISVNQNGVMIK